MHTEQVAETRANIEKVRVEVLPDGRMTPKNASRYLGREEGTLSNWRCLGEGPEWVRVGGRIFYYQDALDEYVLAEISVVAKDEASDESQTEAKDNEAAEAEAKRREDDEDEEADLDTLEAA